jgi:hypothetical protein
MSQTEVHQEFRDLVESIDAKRTEIANMKAEDVAQELFQVLFVDRDKYMHLFNCFQSRSTNTIGSYGLSEIHEPMREACAIRDAVLYSDKLLDETGAQFIQTIQDTATEHKIDLAQAFFDLDGKSTDKRNSAAIDIITVIKALLQKGYNVYDLLWT